MTDIVITLTPDEVANVQSALEHFLDYLDDHGARDYEDEDLAEIVESYTSALSKVNAAGYEALT